MKVQYYGDKTYCIAIETGESEWLIQFESAISLYEQLGVILAAVAKAKGVPLTSAMHSDADGESDGVCPLCGYDHPGINCSDYQ